MGDLFLKFFIYSRKSVSTGRGESIGNQIEMCRQYIKDKFSGDDKHNIIIYEDEGFSAKNTDRPQFQAMLRDMLTGKPDFVVCYRLDRISRSVTDFTSLIEQLNERSISFICIREEFDTSKPMGKAMMYIASVFAQLERETIAERVRDNMLLLARTGRWLGGTAPTGYTSERMQEIILDGKIKASCRLKEIPEELETVDLMYNIFLELRSIAGVGRHLIKSNIRSRTGGFYSLTGIKQILQNPVYCIGDREALAYFKENHADVCFEERDCSDRLGLLAYNKRDYRKKHAPRQPIEQWIVAIGRHKGSISGEKWTKVQAALRDAAPTGERPTVLHNSYSLLSGILVCEQCQCRMFSKMRTGKGKEAGLFDYLCSSKLRGGADQCTCQNISGQQADDLVSGYLIQNMGKHPDIERQLQKLKKGLLDKRQEETPEKLNAKIKKNSREADRLIYTLSQNNLDQAAVQRINSRISLLDREISELTDRSSKIQEQDLKSSQCIEIEADRVIKMAEKLSSLQTIFPDLSISEKRIFIKILVRKIIWDGKTLHIYICSG